MLLYILISPARLLDPQSPVQLLNLHPLPLWMISNQLKEAHCYTHMKPFFCNVIRYYRIFQNYIVHLYNSMSICNYSSVCVFSSVSVSSWEGCTRNDSTLLGSANLPRLPHRPSSQITGNYPPLFNPMLIQC